METMKPILVKNQSEWERLAPVLEALEYVWFKSNQKPTQVDIWDRWTMSFCIIIKGNEISCTANISNFQTVDEYLQAQEPNDKPLFNMPIYKPTDYKEMEIENKRLKAIETKYETLLQGVKDAKAEMERRAIKANEIGNKEKDNDAIFAAFGLNMALEILTDKTNVL
jgi:hypothetical protein